MTGLGGEKSLCGGRKSVLAEKWTVQRLDAELHRGISEEILNREQRKFIAPGITVGEYVETLTTFGNIEVEKGVVYYVRRCVSRYTERV